MSKRKNTEHDDAEAAEAFADGLSVVEGQDNGVGQESSQGHKQAKKRSQPVGPKNNRMWTVWGLRIADQVLEVVAQDLTRGRADKLISGQQALLRRLYSHVVPVKCRMGQVVQL